MSLFGQLFGATGGGTTVPTIQDGVGKIDVEFIEHAAEMMDDFIELPNAIWNAVSENSVADPDLPFVVGKPTISSYNVKILFAQDDLEDRQFFKYLKETSSTNGQVNGYMLAYTEFEPRLKDTVDFGGTLLVVNAIDVIRPIDKVILYFIEFGT